MIGRYHYAGPDGDGIATLPPGTGAAVGSEYCVHLLPAEEELRHALSAASARAIPLLLLTPYFRDAELKRAIALLRAIPRKADVDVAVNDWGALNAVHALFPWLRLSLGRLLSGQKRCPRIGISPRLTPRGRAWHGEGLWSSRLCVEYLETAFGIRGFHVDVLEWAEGGGDGRAPERGDRESRLWLHGPGAIVTLSDVCPWIGGKSSAAIPACGRPCRHGAVVLRNPSMGGELIQRGKARFAERTPPVEGKNAVRPTGRLVLYRDLP